jgi:hypothetical protein
MSECYQFDSILRTLYNGKVLVSLHISHCIERLQLHLGCPTPLVSPAGFAVSSLTSPRETAQALSQPY